MFQWMRPLVLSAFLIFFSAVQMGALSAQDSTNQLDGGAVVESPVTPPAETKTGFDYGGFFDMLIGVDERINKFLSPIADTFSSFIFYSIQINGTKMPLVVVWLALAALICTLYFGFMQFRTFGHGISLVRGRYDDGRGPGEISRFQALSTALSGTVGLGNIAGVAIAVSIGGAGATFWMILCGLLGMAMKFAECMLGVKYRKINPDGTVSGGPMYYLSRGFEEKGATAGMIGRFLAIIFAIFCVGGAFGAGNLFQANQSFQQVLSVTGGESSIFHERAWLFGLIMAFVVGLVIIGGIRSIACVTSKIVPFMAILYLITATVIVAMNYDKIGWAFGEIINGAFSPEGIEGGLVGVLIQGFKRAAFSNEAGFGSAAIAHAAVHTDEPVSQGIVASLGPFIDTIVICTMTALVIIITGSLDASSGDGIAITSKAFESSFAWFPYILAVAVVLFAFSTMISWSYYGEKAWGYLFGENKFVRLIFKLLFLGAVVAGCAMNLSSVINFSDAMVFAMALINIVGLYVLMPVVKEDLRNYLSRLKSGEIRRIS